MVNKNTVLNKSSPTGTYEKVCCCRLRHQFFCGSQLLFLLEGLLLFLSEKTVLYNPPSKSSSLVQVETSLKPFFQREKEKMPFLSQCKKKKKQINTPRMCNTPHTFLIHCFEIALNTRAERFYRYRDIYRYFVPR